MGDKYDKFGNPDLNPADRVFKVRICREGTNSYLDLGKHDPMLAGVNRGNLRAMLAQHFPGWCVNEVVYYNHGSPQY